MKKTQRRDLFTTILRNRIPYFAISIFVALGIALYAGISWANDCIDKSLDTTYDNNRYAHLRLSYPLGMSEEQIRELLQIDGVDDAEGYNFICRFFELYGERYQAGIYQLTEHINVPTVVEGTLPAKADEIAVLASWARDNDMHIGDTITFMDSYGSDNRELRPISSIAGWDPDSDEEPDTSTTDPGYLKGDTFTITALVDSPEFLLALPTAYGSSPWNSIMLDAVIFVTKEAMDPALFNGYTLAAIYSDRLAAMNATSKEYEAECDLLESRVTALTDTWSNVSEHYSETLEQFGKKLDEADQKLKDAEKEISDKQKQLDDGQQEYDDGKKTLDNKQQEYNAALTLYNQKMAEANNAGAQLKAAWSAYNCLKEDADAATVLNNDIQTFKLNYSSPPTAQTQADFLKVKSDAGYLCSLIDSQRDTISAAEALIGDATQINMIYHAVSQLSQCSDPANMMAILSSIGDMDLTYLNTMLASLYTQLNTAQGNLDAAYEMLGAASSLLDDGLKQLNNGRAQLEDARQKLSDGRKELSDARAELEEKQQEYSDSRDKYDEMSGTSEYVSSLHPGSTTRDSNISLATAEGTEEILEKARSILASVFLFVALLVGYSTLARMVADTGPQLGTKKALGFNRWETMRLYLYYAYTAAFLGLLLGILGAIGIEAVFMMVFRKLFMVTKIPLVIRMKYVLLPFLAELILLTAAVALATLQQLRRKAIDLINGNAENKNRTARPLRLPVFRKLPTVDRIIFANLKKDKRRVFAMLIGIGGSAMLICSGLTCWMNMSSSWGVEFNKYFRFDTVIRFDTSNEKSTSNIRKLLGQYGLNYAEVYFNSMITHDRNDLTRLPDVFVPVDDEEFARVLSFETTDGKKVERIEGVWVSDTFSEKQGMKAGDLLTLQHLNGTTVDFPVSGFYTNYQVALTVVMDEDTWLAAYPDTEPNAFLVNTEGADAAALQADLNELDGYICSIPYKENSRSAASSVLSIIAVSAGIFTVMALLLLLMLLINLLDMYISEKKRELIILKINGYGTGTARKYIWKDTLILTITGILVGMVIGTIFGNITQNSWEGSTMLMVHGISLPACAITAAVTGLMSFIITLFELKKVNRFRLSDINN